MPSLLFSPNNHLPEHVAAWRSRRRGAAVVAVLSLTLLSAACGRSTATNGDSTGSSAAAANSSPAPATSSAVDASVTSSAPDSTGNSSTARSSDTDGSAGSDTESAATNGAAKDLVPADIKSAGVLKVATAEGYPPMEMYATGTSNLVGVDPELAAMIAKQLGLKLSITNASFPGLIPGLQSGQWQLAMSSMSDTAERQQAVDFVDYFSAGGSIMVLKGNPDKINGMADLCGKSVVAGKGSSNLAILTAFSDTRCAGNKMKISESEDAPTGLLQMDSKRAIATVVDYPVAALLAKQSGKYEVLPKQYQAGPWGIAIKKNTPLTKAVSAALDELIGNGEYGKLLAKYDVTGSAVKSATVNGK
ncbi:MAG: ABC transporter substrate-binding protein [Nakamurella sp.]